MTNTETAFEDLYNMFMQAPAPICILHGVELRFEMANPLYHKFSGRSELVGKTVLEAMPELRGQGFDDLLREVMRTGEAFVGNELLLRIDRDDDGQLEDTYWTFIYSPLRNRQGVVDRVMAFCTDVTDQVIARKQAEAERAKAEAQRAFLEATLEQIPAGVIIAEAPSGKLILGNRQVDEIWRRPFIHAASIGEYEQYPGFHPDRRPYQPSEWPLARSLTSGETIVNEEIMITRGDGTEGITSVSSAPIRDAQGHTVAAVVTFFDLTEQRQVELAMARRDREMAVLEERQRLARDLHDAVSQSLFTASIMTQSLPRLWKMQPEKAESQMDMIHTLVRGALAEMRTLLLELRPEGITQARLSHLLTQLSHAVQARTRLKIAVRYRGDEAALPPDVQLAFYRVAQESINNILKHGNASQVVVSLWRAPAQVILIVRDNGKGFDPDAAYSGFGLIGMRERAASIGAMHSIKSRIGKGTRVRLVWDTPTAQ
jgi:signal transduction histidine kinase